MSRDDSPLLDAAEVRALLTELGARLAADGVEGRLFLVGGAAIALAFTRRRVTRDLDAVFEPKREIYDHASAIAREHGLPPNWLNDGVKGLLPDKTHRSRARQASPPPDCTSASPPPNTCSR